MTWAWEVVRIGRLAGARWRSAILRTTLTDYPPTSRAALLWPTGGHALAYVPPMDERERQLTDVPNYFPGAPTLTKGKI